MSGIYEIFEKSPRGDLVFIERAEGLERAKQRFVFLTLASQREYMVWDPARGCEVLFRTEAH